MESFVRAALPLARSARDQRHHHRSETTAAAPAACQAFHHSTAGSRSGTSTGFCLDFSVRTSSSVSNCWLSLGGHGGVLERNLEEASSAIGRCCTSSPIAFPITRTAFYDSLVPCRLMTNFLLGANQCGSELRGRPHPPEGHWKVSWRGRHAPRPRPRPRHAHAHAHHRLRIRLRLRQSAQLLHALLRQHVRVPG